MSFRQTQGIGSYYGDIFYCGSKTLLQTRLQQLGFYNGGIDGVIGPQSWAAIVAFANSQGMPSPAPVPRQQQAPLPLDFCQALERAVSPGATSTIRNISSSMLDSLRQSAVAPLPASTPPPQTTYSDEQSLEPVVTPPGWWASQTSTTKYALIGGGVVAVAALAFFLTRSR